MSIELEWDEIKRQTTLVERGVDFADMALMDWDTAQTIADERDDYGEQRFVTIGFIGERLHVCAWCYRGEKIRIISLRKANKREEKAYDTA